METYRGRGALLHEDGTRGRGGTLAGAPRRRACVALLTLPAVALAVAGCGASGSPPHPATPPHQTTLSKVASDGTNAVSFAWLHPARPPAGWRRVRITTGAVLAYPPGWRTVGGDLGTATAGLRDARGRYLGYLNLTPRQGSETLANWAAFRVAHQHEEGERDVRQQGAAREVPFGRGRASCVQDAYTTVIGARYVELACLVRGARASTVVVGAALQRSWPAQRATLQRAIAALST